ncbi:hypothetical protein J2R98_001957 [Alkalibacillus filiformis]|uniref:Cytochrome c oxidase subunit 2A n=1 Tax=Alkalibacillus filiformis TaxID=200990 RepID=A0ABU0DV01_9BACI|nr:hypothetical protein [Alkalibacillus filiformis]MDQ0352123.1 hypothetical protein [Alkalibacillus filiformis]
MSNHSKEPKLFGTFVSVLLVGLFIVMAWVSIFFGFM